MSFGKNSKRYLILCDSNVHERVFRRVQNTLPSAVCVCWSKFDRSTQSEVDRYFSQNWDILISVYSDYILSREELNRVRIPLNIHPALPSLPGVGYDILPLLRGHTKQGATLHWIDTKIDHGDILDTSDREIGQGIDYPTIRRMNQESVLNLFDRWLNRLARMRSDEFNALIRVPIEQGRGWNGAYVSKLKLLKEIQAYQVRHPEPYSRLKIPDTVIQQLKSSATRILR